MLVRLKSDTDKREIDMSSEIKAKFRIKAPEAEPISSEDKKTGKVKAPTKPIFKAKDATYRDKLAAMRLDEEENGEENGTKTFQFNVKGSDISDETSEITAKKKGFFSKISQMKKKAESKLRKEESDKKKISFTPKKDTDAHQDGRARSKKFKVKDSGESTKRDASPQQGSQKVAFKKKDNIQVEKTTVVEEKVAFKKKDNIQVEETTVVEEKIAFKKKESQVKEYPAERKEKVAFKRKEPPRAEVETERKKKISFKQKERTRVEKTAPPKEDTGEISEKEILSETRPIEHPKKDTASEVQIVVGDSRGGEKHKKEKEPVDGFTLKKSISTKIKKKSKSGGFFSSFILNGFILCIFTIGATFILSSLKNSPDTSTMWKICFVPQLFLVYVIIMVLMYVTSLILVFIGIHKKFKER